MTRIIQPYHAPGKESCSVYDPCCGSGGMFVQSAEFIEKHKGNKKEVTIYGQEENPQTYKLARMNLAIRGLSCNLGNENASTFKVTLFSSIMFISSVSLINSNK